MTTSPPAIGSIRLADSATPTLEAGLYRLNSSLVVERRDPDGQVSALDAPSAHVIHFEITGPRFLIDRADIGDRYPPPDANGAFGDRLPHVVIGRRTLPWERAATDGTPWVAVMVFAADEAQLSTGTLSTQVPAAVVNALKALDPFTDDPQVTVIRAKDLPTFRALLPSRGDVKLLAHVRQVNLADTALAAQDDDGIFAVVTGNRLPLANGAAGTKYLACIVSLEGRDDLWTVPDGQPVPPLIVLYSWSFTSTGAGGTFEHLAATLDVAPFGAPAAGTTAIIAADGTGPVQRVERDGSSSNTRYRGPLLGIATGQALNTATSDISTSAAFELGRLLAASDGRFLRELAAWHRASDSSARTAMAADVLARVVEPAEASRARVAGLTRTAPKRATTASVREELAGRLTTILGTRANLWRVHPAATRIHAVALERVARGAQPLVTGAGRAAKKSRTAAPAKATAKKSTKPARKRRPGRK